MLCYMAATEASGIPFHTFFKQLKYQQISTNSQETFELNFLDRKIANLHSMICVLAMVSISFYNGLVLKVSRIYICGQLIPEQILVITGLGNVFSLISTRSFYYQQHNCLNSQGIFMDFCHVTAENINIDKLCP